MSESYSCLFAARVYARQGIRVIPVGSKKVPLIRDWTNLATNDEAILEQWWAKNPKANVGMVLGDQSADFGLLVLDIDVKNGKRGDLTLAKLLAERGVLPETLHAHTPTGGQHIFLKFEKGLNVRGGVELLGPGLDVLASGQ